MKKTISKIIALVLCFTMIFAATSPMASAITEDKPAAEASDFTNSMLKGFYNGLNAVVEVILKVVNALIPNPSDWKSQSEYDSDEVNFMAGRETYQTETADGAYWSLGYASKSFVPEDIGTGRYYIGRDVTNRIAKGVYDDNRIRVAVIDDNSGEGALVFGAVDSLGVTSTDVRAIREGVLEYCEKNNIKVAAIDIAATHSHTALDGRCNGVFL